METIKYTKTNLINFFKNNEFITNTLINISSRTNTQLILNKNNKFQKKYGVLILKDKKTIFWEESNNYLDLIENIHKFLIKYKLIEEDEIINYEKSPEVLFQNPKIQTNINSNKNDTFEPKKLTENELNNLKKELNMFFENISSLDYDLIFDWKWKFEVYKWGDLLESFSYSIEFIKQFIIKYLLNYPKKLKNINEYNKTEVISISYDNQPMLHIKISDFMSDWKQKEMEKFEEENQNNDNIFSLCNWDDYVSESSLNCFIEDIFQQFKIKNVKWVYII